MANPEYAESLDRLDQLSVILYRLGITAFAITTLIYAGSLGALHGWYAGELLSPQSSMRLFAISTALCAANIHVYSKLVRLVIAWSGWLGVLVLLTVNDGIGTLLALGLMFVTVSGIALKESFCFQIVGLKWMPLLLIIGLVSQWLEHFAVAAVALAVAGVILLYLAISKWRMPLHFDIGVKANYQV